VEPALVRKIAMGRRAPRVPQLAPLFWFHAVRSEICRGPHRSGIGENTEINFSPSCAGRNAAMRRHAQGSNKGRPGADPSRLDGMPPIRREAMRTDRGAMASRWETLKTRDGAASQSPADRSGSGREARRRGRTARNAAMAGSRSSGRSGGSPSARLPARRAGARAQASIASSSIAAALRWMKSKRFEGSRPINSSTRSFTGWRSS